MFPRHASLHPALYQRGLLDRVLQARAELIPRCPAAGIDRRGGVFKVTTPLYLDGGVRRVALTMSA